MEYDALDLEESWHKMEVNISSIEVSHTRVPYLVAHLVVFQFVSSRLVLRARRSCAGQKFASRPAAHRDAC